MIELTRVHDDFEADAFFPEIDSQEWNLNVEEKFTSSPEQPYAYSYLTYKKQNQ
jgi:dihydrofolate reductase